MTAEEFAEAVDKLIAAAREGGLSDAELIGCSRIRGLDEGLSTAQDLGRIILAKSAAARASVSGSGAGGVPCAARSGPL